MKYIIKRAALPKHIRVDSCQLVASAQQVRCATVPYPCAVGLVDGEGLLKNVLICDSIDQCDALFRDFRAALRDLGGECTCAIVSDPRCNHLTIHLWECKGW